MLKCVITLYEESQKAISDSPAEKRITWTYIKTTLAHLIQKVVDCKFLVRTLLRCTVLYCTFCFSVMYLCLFLYFYVACFSRMCNVSVYHIKPVDAC